MSTNRNDTRTCAAKNCKRKGVLFLKVIHLNKCGWFCEPCKEDLIKDDLVQEEVTLLRPDKTEGQVGLSFKKQTNHSTNRQASIRISDTYPQCP